MTRPMTMSRFGLLAAFLLQAGLLGWLIIDRALLLANGREVRLTVMPVDPRDLFRGDYVVLSYPISRVDAALAEDGRSFSPNETVYVSLGQDGGAWKATALGASPPPDGLALKGKVTGTAPTPDCRPPCRAYRVAYNLERFFVPEGKGRRLERLRNDQRMEVDVAVARDGRGALKRLLVDGAVRFETNPF